MSNFKNAYKFIKSKQAQTDYNNEIVNKTWHYQKKFGFETSTRQGHEFWNNEADAFKHTFLSADLYFKYGDIGSTVLGIGHELQTPSNPQGEWNMDSWNNNQGREIAREIQKEYGDNFMKLSQQQRDDIIATKVMDKMRSGQLITHPNDSRKYYGITENFVNVSTKKQESKLPYIPTRGIGGVQNNGIPTGFATSVDTKQSSLSGYTNPLTGNNRIYTREEIGAMTPDEFAKNEKEIDAQIKAFNGTMPTNGDLQKEAITGGDVVYVNPYTRSDGTKVNGYYRSK